MNQNNYTLKFLDSTIHFHVDRSIDNVMRKIISFFSTHFLIHESSLIGEPFVTITVDPIQKFNKEYIRDHIPICIRKSSAHDFNLYGVKSFNNNNEIIYSENTKTALVINSNERKVDIFISENSYIQIIEFIRDIIIKNEEQNGTVVLHAASVAKDGIGFVIVGKKGAGKSTFTLDLVTNCGFDFLSGDKTFLKLSGNQIVAYGWPEFPHLGIETIRQYPNLVSRLEQEGFKLDQVNHEKILFTANILQESLGYNLSNGGIPIKFVMFPDIKVNGVRIIEESKQYNVSSLIEHLEFSLNNPFAHWHNLIEIINQNQINQCISQYVDFLAELKYYYVPGNISLNMKESIETLIK